MGEALDLGGKLRRIRLAAGLSQRALARAAGVTNSTVSLIESNRSNPSIGQLRRILDAIPISLAEFFALGSEADTGPFFSASDLVEIGKDDVSYRQVGRTGRDKGIQMLDELYQAGSDTGRVMLQHEGEEAGIVISGRLEVTVGDKKRILGPGAAYLFDSRMAHRFRCVGPDPARVISAATPPGF